MVTKKMLTKLVYVYYNMRVGISSGIIFQRKQNCPNLKKIYSTIIF